MIDLSTRENTELLERYRPIPISYLLRYSILKRIKSGRGDPGRNRRQGAREGRRCARPVVGRPTLSCFRRGDRQDPSRAVDKQPAASGAEDQGLPVQRRPEMAEDPPLPAMPGEREPGCRVRGRVDKRPGEVLADSGKRVHQRGKTPGLKGHPGNSAGHEPKDPLAFAGTGVFRANRGVLFIDELPAIRTKVQVLLHPIIEEKKAILEEYNWEYPLDLIVVSTGNPEGFSHVNEVPRPLLDRLETVYMDLPDEDVEFSIMMMERFGGRDGAGPEEVFPDGIPFHRGREAERARAVVDLVPHQQSGQAEQDLPLARQEGEHKGHDAGDRPYLLLYGNGTPPGNDAAGRDRRPEARAAGPGPASPGPGGLREPPGDHPENRRAVGGPGKERPARSGQRGLRQLGQGADRGGGYGTDGAAQGKMGWLHAGFGRPEGEAPGDREDGKREIHARQVCRGRRGRAAGS